MRGFRETGRMDVPDAAWAQARAVFHGFRLDDAGTAAEIAFWHAACGYVADPHTAIGIAASRALGKQASPTIALATAHPAKFPDAIERATGRRPSLPDHLADLYSREERFTTAPNDLRAVEEQVRQLSRRN